MAKKFASDIRAGRAYVELLADDSALSRGLKAAERKLTSFGKEFMAFGAKIMAAGAAITVPMTAAAKAAAESGAAIWDMSSRTGMSVESLSRLGFAAEMAGTDMETLEGSVRKMQRVIFQAERGSGQAAASLASIGLAIEDVRNLSPEDQFKAVAKAIAGIADPTEKAGAAMQMFGSSGTSVLPLLENLERASRAAESLGFVKSTESARDAKEMMMVFNVLAKAVKSLWDTVGQAIFPILKESTRTIIRLVLSARDWLKQNKDLIASVFQLGKVLTVAGAAIVAVGWNIFGLGKVFGVLAVAAGALTTALGFVLSPLGLIVVAVGAATAYIVAKTGLWSKAAEFLGKAFQTIKDDVTGAVDGIKAALSKGDVSTAVKILWATIKLEWQRGKNFIEQLWIGMVNGFSQTWKSLGPVIQEVGSRITDTFAKVWDSIGPMATAVASRIVDTMAEAGVAAGRALWGGIKGSVDAASAMYVADEERNRQKKRYEEQKVADDQMSQYPENTPEFIAKQKALTEDWNNKQLAAINKTEKDLILAAGGVGDILSGTTKAMAKIWSQPLPAIDTTKLKEVAAIWSKPLPPIDTTAISNALDNKGQTPEQQNRLDDAQRELDRLKAQQFQEIEDAKNKPPDAVDNALNFEPWLKKLNMAVDGLDAIAAGGVSSVGTFNAAATFGLAGSAADRTAAATEGIRDLTKKGNKLLEQIAEDGEAEFT